MINDTSAQECVFENADAVISKNLEDIFRAEASVFERKFAHLCERANIIAQTIKANYGNGDIMDAVSHLDAASEIYALGKGEGPDFSGYFADVNMESSSCLSVCSDILDRLYLCKSIAAFDSGNYNENDAVFWISEDERDIPVETKDKKVSFVRGNQSGRAFETFAKFVPGVLAEYEEDFKSACEAVAAGESTYAIIPVENSLDGRLNSFHRLIEKYALSIVLCADIVSDDGESSTKFALVYKKFEIIKARGERIFECRITFSDPSELCNIILAANYFGVRVCKIYSLPLSGGGRDNSFGIIFRTDGAQIGGFFCYLFLEYPQFSSVGLYTDIGVE
ncbi:MAG: hypothetical protein J6D11_01005 [Clostridia bacterium]|nr:hypothetical protein [Clostridia bacterium]